MCVTLFLVSCTQNKTVETETTTPSVEKEVVTVETKAPENSTEVSVGQNGIKVETKDGSNGTKVQIKDGSADIEIKE